MSFGVAVCLGLSVFPQHNSQMNDRKVFKLGMAWFWGFKVRVRVIVRVKETAIQRGFQHY